MIKSLRLIFPLMLLFLFCSPWAIFAAERGPLVVLNWGLYLDPELVEAFENEFNTKVNQVLYNSDEDRDARLVTTDGKGYDLILTSGISLDEYATRGWLAPLDRSKAPNFKHLSDRWKSAFNSTEKYGVPYFWGTLGIMYRADLVKQPITSWKQFFNPAEELQGRITLMDDSREIVSMALKSLGYSGNSEDPAAIEQVKALLKAQKPYVKSYTYVSIKEDSALVKGEVVAAMAYNGDALMVAEHNENIVYVLPEEGGNLWVDYFVIAAKAKNPDLAYEFLNFINDPVNAAQQAEYVYSATPNKAAEKFLSKEFLADQTIYPPVANLDKSEFHKELSPKGTVLRNKASALILR
jgi:spermidine/putrescine transport system substrate-binding protein